MYGSEWRLILSYHILVLCICSLRFLFHLYVLTPYHKYKHAYVKNRSLRKRQFCTCFLCVCWCSFSAFGQTKNVISAHPSTCLYKLCGGGPKTRIFFKKKFIYSSYKKHSKHSKYSPLEAIHLSSLFSHYVKHLWNCWSLMLLSASCEAVFTSSTVANLFLFNVFFHCRE